MIDSWIHEYKNDHELCHWPEPKRLPTRVIDVGSNAEMIDPYLLITQEEVGNWATLSYCWGKDMPFKTTLDTIDGRRSEFAKDEHQFCLATS
jgi:hypothetical protein